MLYPTSTSTTMYPLLFFYSYLSIFSAINADAGETIFLLAGQSNMAGRGGVVNDKWDGYVPPQSSPNPAILRLSADLNWQPAAEPLHRDIDYFRACGVGPGMAFANSLLRKDSSIGVVGLVPCAVGGTNISEWARGGRLYNQMIRRAEAALVGGGAIKGLLWYQGESDTVNREDAELYKGRLERFFDHVRSDLFLPTLPIIQVALASGAGPYIERVREAQLRTRLVNLQTIDAKGLGLEPDRLHLTTLSQVTLGEMLAQAFPQSHHAPVIRFVPPPAVGFPPSPAWAFRPATGMAERNVVKGTGRSKHTWTNEEDALLELQASGKYAGADNGFKPGYLNGVQQLVDVSLPNSGLKAEPHIKSRMKTWKTHFSIVYVMVHTSEFGWDEEKKCVVAEDSVWDEYVKSHKGAAIFRGKPFLFYDKLCTIFGKDRATGSRAIDLGEEDAVPETQKSSPIDIDNFDFVEDGVQDARRSEGPTSSVTSKRKRRKSIDGDELYRETCNEMQEVLVRFGEIVGDSLNANVKENIEARELYEKVGVEIKALPGINAIKRFKARDVIGKDVMRAREFLTLNEEEKIDMIKAYVDDAMG